MYTLKTLVLFFFSLLTVYSLNAQQYQDFTMQYEGQTRSYTLYVPAGYDGTVNMPLLFNFHGGDGDIVGQIFTSDMSTLADNDGFLVAYPQALADPNDGGSANWLHKDPTDVDDIYFIEALIQKIDEDYAIDLSRVYACGYSLGATFSPNWMDWPMLYTGNPYVIQPGNIFFMHMILMDSDNELAMNLGENYLLTEDGNKRIGQQKLDLVTL